VAKMKMDNDSVVNKISRLISGYYDK